MYFTGSNSGNHIRSADPHCQESEGRSIKHPAEDPIHGREACSGIAGPVFCCHEAEPASTGNFALRAAERGGAGHRNAYAMVPAPFCCPGFF